MKFRGSQGMADRMAGLRSPRRSWPRGFGFIEIVVILVILGLLATFGLPALLQYSMRSRIQAGETALRQVARLETQWLAEHHSYASLGDLGYPVDSSLAAIYLNKDGSITGHASDDVIYRITLKLGGAAAGGDGAVQAYYLLTAEPMNDQVKDNRCGTLSLASTGQVGATGGDGEAACWHKPASMPAW